jgi:predicted Zn-dependent protease
MYDEALDHLRAALRLEPDDPVMHEELGVALALKGDYTEASDAMESALAIAPDDSWTRVLLGLVYLEMGRDELGAETLSQAALERLEDGEAQLLAALATAAVGWDVAAEEALARVEFAEGIDSATHDEAAACIARGAEEARAFLRDSVITSVLHDRLQQPI